MYLQNHRKIKSKIEQVSESIKLLTNGISMALSFAGWSILEFDVVDTTAHKLQLIWTRSSSCSDGMADRK